MFILSQFMSLRSMSSLSELCRAIIHNLRLNCLVQSVQINFAILRDHQTTSLICGFNASVSKASHDKTCKHLTGMHRYIVINIDEP